MLYILALHLAAGLLVVLPLVSIRQAGRRFFLVVGAISLVGLGSALGLALAGSLSGGVSAGLAGGAAVGLSLHLGALRGDRWHLAAWLLRLVAVLCVAASVAVGLELASGRQASWVEGAVMVAACLGQCLLLGSTLLAMILGHFYLILPRLPIEPLRRISAVLIVAVVLRWLTCGLGLWLARDAMGGGLRWLILGDGIFLLARLLFGLVGPAFVAPMIWGTVRIRSTQSATGILYAATAMVFLGEAAAAWLLVAQGVAT